MYHFILPFTGGDSYRKGPDGIFVWEHFNARTIWEIVGKMVEKCGMDRDECRVYVRK